MNAQGIVIAAGTVSFFGNMKEQGTVPSNTIPIVFGTTMLAIGAGLVSGPLSEPVKWLAVLMLLTALIRYVPSFSKKGKNNG